MLAAVKTPHTEIRIRGEVPEKLIKLLRAEYGEAFRVEDEDDEADVDIFETDWYKKTSAAMTPGKALKIYRENYKLTQAALGEKLGGLHRQQISNMENGIRSITVEMAKKLAAIFNTSPARFLGIR